MGGEDFNRLIVSLSGLIGALMILLFALLIAPGLLREGYRLVSMSLHGDVSRLMLVLTGVVMAVLVANIIFRVEMMSSIFRVNPAELSEIGRGVADRVLEILNSLLEQIDLQ